MVLFEGFVAFYVPAAHGAHGVGPLDTALLFRGVRVPGVSALGSGGFAGLGARRVSVVGSCLGLRGAHLLSTIVARGAIVVCRRP